MRFALVLKSAVSPGIAGLQPIAFGTRAEMLALADRQYDAVHWPAKDDNGEYENRRFTPDGAERAASFRKDSPVAIVPAGVLPRAKRRAA